MMRSLLLSLVIPLGAVSSVEAAPVPLDELLARAPGDPTDAARAGAVEASAAHVDEARAARKPKLNLELEGGTSRGEIVRIPGTETYVHGTAKADDATLHGRYGVRVRMEG